MLFHVFITPNVLDISPHILFMSIPLETIVYWYVKQIILSTYYKGTLSIVMSSKFIFRACEMS